MGMRDTAVRFFFSGQAPVARPARCPMLTCSSRSCKCPSPTMVGYRPLKVYLVLSPGCNRKCQVATASAKLRRCDGNGSGCQGQAAVHIVFHTIDMVIETIHLYNSNDLTSTICTIQTINICNDLNTKLIFYITHKCLESN